ncbi:type III secretion system chaperone [Myxococcus sp. RHSTA-1-4]|uniref:type III secretion system chaperone n=1 Tax=Myxococcus sp. RHSTA-1-4 TaxID=2874601 RepID=UPI001CBE0844|nr:type III secretion system chaperone [Myxococcus sp. RHSTA-1-4]MBZ4416358.1 type III secretion system chaperone [Myxococcus sp. RHSTA-1-4]
MRIDEAQWLVQSFMRAHGENLSPGLNPQGFGGAAVGDAQIYFEFVPKTGELKCSALIYRFRDAPRPGVLEGFRDEEKAGTDTGGGAVDFEQESKSLFLSRTYTAAPPDKASFTEDMNRLMGASLAWGEGVFDRVATKVNAAAKK